MRLATALSALALVSMTGLALAAAPVALEAQNPEIRREGQGARRAAVTAMELKPFDAALLKGLKDWTNGSEPTADSLKGKPVVLVFFSSWVPASRTALAQAAQLAKTPDVVVIGIAASERFDDAKKLFADNGHAFLLARDEFGAMRKAMQSDSDPDFYVVDRAGNLRFADIETASASRALELVAGETEQTAAAKPAEVAAAAKAATEAASRTRDTGRVPAPGERVKPVVKLPDSSAYEGVLWPRKNPQEAVQQHGTDIQGKTMPAEVDPGAMEWLQEKPADLTGKVVVVDFWATWCGPCKRSKPMIDDLADKNRDVLAVIAMSGYNDPKPDVLRYLRSNPSELYHAYDNEQKVGKALSVNAFPTVFVLSSDGIVRWMGNPLDPSFRQTVEQIIKLDPGVAARRAALAKAGK
jgi:thiol-disulfide isomerase/thioredoxin